MRMRMRYICWRIQYFWHRLPEELCIWLAWKMPRMLAYWAFVRVHVEGKDSPGTEFNEVATAWLAYSSRIVKMSAKMPAVVD